MPGKEKGYFDYSAEEWVRNQHTEDEWNDMDDGEFERQVELEEQEREFILAVIDSFSSDD